jgi:hypothetical protein
MDPRFLRQLLLGQEPLPTQASNPGCHRGPPPRGGHDARRVTRNARTMLGGFSGSRPRPPASVRGEPGIADVHARDLLAAPRTQPRRHRRPEHAPAAEARSGALGARVADARKRRRGKRWPRHGEPPTKVQVDSRCDSAMLGHPPLPRRQRPPFSP